ncbi:MAG TPA: CHC2 zinc finger domain-containing protein [Patescibacteria group bacterium]|nr:CHC2 zinc finger domain-containing protein [Patescibacteria group bacterium]
MDQIEEIRSKIDLVQFISEFLPLKKAGRNFKGLCPFHAEKTPSFMVSPERQIWHCFGCGAGGDVFGFLMQMERIEFGEALRLLAKKTGITLQSYQPTKSESEKEKLFQANHLAAEFFHYLLLNHKIGDKALSYILQRGISKDSLSLFKIGYAPPMWDGLQKFLVGKKNFAPADLEKAGLTIRGSRSGFYDRFRNRLMFPLLDHRGNVTGFAGRVLPEGKEARLPSPAARPPSFATRNGQAQAAGGQAKYVNTPETLIYHKSELLYPLQITKEAIKKENAVVVVEGELDAISSYQIGIENVVAIKGSALTDAQARLLKRFAENLILSLDADAAGDMASRRGIEIADGLGLNIKVVSLEKYKDPDEAAQKEPEYLKKQLAKAENIYDFFINSAFKRLRGQTAEEKKKIGQEIIPILGKIEDQIMKDVFIKKLADRLGVNEESIILQIEKFLFKTPSVPKTSSPPEIRQRREILEEYFLALLFQSKETETLLKEKGLLSLPLSLKLIKALADYLTEKKKFSSRFFFKALPGELREGFDRLYLVDFGERIEEPDWVAKEIQKTKAQLETLKIKEELRAIWQALRQNPAAEEESRQKILRLTQKLSALEKA